MKDDVDSASAKQVQTAQTTECKATTDSPKMNRSNHNNPQTSQTVTEDQPEAKRRPVSPSSIESPRKKLQAAEKKKKRKSSFCQGRRSGVVGPVPLLDSDGASISEHELLQMSRKCMEDTLDQMLSSDVITASQYDEMKRTSFQSLNQLGQDTEVVQLADNALSELKRRQEDERMVLDPFVQEHLQYIERLKNESEAWKRLDAEHRLLADQSERHSEEDNILHITSRPTTLTADQNRILDTLPDFQPFSAYLQHAKEMLECQVDEITKGLAVIEQAKTKASHMINTQMERLHAKTKAEARVTPEQSVETETPRRVIQKFGKI